MVTGIAIRVLELADGIAAGYAGRSLAAMGAEVIKVHDGDPTGRGQDGLALAEYEYLNVAKRSVALDLSSPDDHQRLDRLVAASDVVLSSYRDGAYYGDCDFSRVSSVNPRCSQVVTSPFGTTGPHADLPTSDIIEWAASGYLYITGDPQREPLMGGGPWPRYVCGILATTAALAAVDQAATDGQGRFTDLSVQEVMLGAHQTTFAGYADGIVKTRIGNRHEHVHPLGPLPCADGWVVLGVVGDDQFERLCHAIGEPALAKDPRFAAPGRRFQNADQLDQLLEPWMRGRTRAEVERALQAAQVPAASVLSPGEVLVDEHLRFRDVWLPSSRSRSSGRMPHAPVRADLPLERLVAPAVGAHTEEVFEALGTEQVGAPRRDDREVAREGQHPAGRTSRNRLRDRPLVLDFTNWWAGPLACRILADLGADVIRVERPGSRPFEASGGPSPFFFEVNRSKRSIAIDLKTSEGLEVTRALLDKADVVVENFAPGVMDKLGLGYAAVQQVKQDIIYVSLSGFGQDGPKSAWVSWGPILEACSGLEYLTGYAGGPPTKLGHALPDAVGGLIGSAAILWGLRNRLESGHGCYLDVSQLETYLSFIGPELLAESSGLVTAERRGNRSSHRVPQGCYPCQGTDEWIVLSVSDDDGFVSLRELMGEAAAAWRDIGPTVESRLAHQDAIDRDVAAWTMTHDKSELAARLQEAGVAAFPVLDAHDLASDAHLWARGALADVELSGRQIVLPTFPLRGQAAVKDLHDAHAPRLGEHSSEILSQVAGCDEATIRQLRDAGVVH